jgi:hypothetical protein
MNRWQQVAFGVWAVIVVGGIGRATLYDHRSHRGCYDLYPAAGRHWRNGESLFDLEAPNSLNVFRYHPLVAVGCVPLTVLSNPLGSVVMRVVNFAVLITGMCWWGSKLMRG